MRPRTGRAALPGIFSLIAGDYRRFSDVRGDDPRKRRLLALPTLLLNPSLHAAVLFRLAARSPRPLHWFWRNVLLWKHSCDVGRGVEIGPGLFLPHPYAITLVTGVRIGRDVTLLSGVTIGTRAGDMAEVPVLGDRVIVYAGAVVVGAHTIGDDAVIGANAVVNRDLPAHAICTLGHEAMVVRLAEASTAG